MLLACWRFAARRCCVRTVSAAWRAGARMLAVRMLRLYGARAAARLRALFFGALLSISLFLLHSSLSCSSSILLAFCCVRVFRGMCVRVFGAAYALLCALFVYKHLLLHARAASLRAAFAAGQTLRCGHGAGVWRGARCAALPK